MGNNLSDYLASITNKPEFIHIQKEDYDVIDYVYTTSETFIGSPLLLDCRGIKFDKSGNIIARVLHKFFNVGESQAAFSLDGKTRFYVQEKRDGSMTHSVILNGELRLMTRKGINEISLAAEKCLTNLHRQIIMSHPENTYIFEYTAPDNRIVIGYDKPELTLLAIRNIKTGAYYRTHSEGAVVPTVREYVGKDLFKEDDPAHKYVGSFNRLGDLSFDKFGEGVVLVKSGKFFNRVKVKTEEYVRIHNMVSNFNFMSRKKKLEVCLNGNVDDYAAFLDAGVYEQLCALNDKVQKKIEEIEHYLSTFCSFCEILDKKEFAEAVNSEVNHKYRGIMFAYRNGKDWRKICRKMIIEGGVEV